MIKIQRQSRRLRVLFQFIFVLTPVCICYYWLTVQTPFDFLTTWGLFQPSHEVSAYTTLPLTTTTRMLAVVASLLLAGVIMNALRLLIKLFRHYEDGDIFTLDNVICYQKLGYSVFYWVVASTLYGTAMSLILSFNNPPGQRVLSVSFVGVDFLALVLGVVVVIIAGVMKEAYLLADETSHTI